MVRQVSDTCKAIAFEAHIAHVATPDSKHWGCVISRYLQQGDGLESENEGAWIAIDDEGARILSPFDRCLGKRCPSCATLQTPSTAVPQPFVVSRNSIR